MSPLSTGWTVLCSLLTLFINGVVKSRKESRDGKSELVIKSLLVHTSVAGGLSSRQIVLKDESGKQKIGAWC